MDPVFPLGRGAFTSRYFSDEYLLNSFGKFIRFISFFKLLITAFFNTTRTHSSSIIAIHHFKPKIPRFIHPHSSTSPPVSAHKHTHNPTSRSRAQVSRIRATTAGGSSSTEWGRTWRWSCASRPSGPLSGMSNPLGVLAGKGRVSDILLDKN